MNYEAQPVAATTLIKQLKKEKEATKERVKMCIKRVYMIVGARRARML